MALVGAGILLAIAALALLTFVLPPNRICRHFGRDRKDMRVDLTGYSFSVKYGLRYEYSAQCDGCTYSVHYSIVPWGNIEVMPPGGDA
jgi:hypothetical protein